MTDLLAALQLYPSNATPEYDCQFLAFLLERRPAVRRRSQQPAHQGIGLKIMRSRLRDSNPAGDFVRSVDQVRYERMKTLLVVYAEGIPERLAKIAAATTLIDIQRVFIEMMDESIATATE